MTNEENMALCAIKLRMHDKVWVQKGPYRVPGKVIYASDTGLTIKVQQYKMGPGTRIAMWHDPTSTLRMRNHNGLYRQIPWRRSNSEPRPFLVLENPPK